MIYLLHLTLMTLINAYDCYAGQGHLIWKESFMKTPSLENWFSGECSPLPSCLTSSLTSPVWLASTGCSARTSFPTRCPPIPWLLFNFIVFLLLLLLLFFCYCYCYCFLLLLIVIVIYWTSCPTRCPLIPCSSTSSCCC